MERWLRVRVGGVDAGTKRLLERWLEGDAVVSTGEAAPVVLVPDLRVGFVVVSLLRGKDPVLVLWDGLEKIPATWEKHVVMYGDYRRVGKETAEMLPLLAVELFDGGVRVMHFKTKGQAVEYIARVINRRRDAGGNNR